MEADGVYQEDVATWQLEFLLPSSQLHDVGKVAISDLILNKPGKLTQDEFEEMKKHAAIGEFAIEQIEKKHRNTRFYATPKSSPARTTKSGMAQAIREGFPERISRWRGV